MVTNLPAEARARWVKYLEARTTEEKIRALEDFLSSVPKHKGTENLVAWVRRKLSELREELEESKKRRGGGPSFFVEKHGVAQVVLFGYTLSGKSSLFNALTNARSRVTGLPYTTMFPLPGMVNYEDIQIQLVDTPPFVPEAVSGRVSWGARLVGLARNADALLIVLDSTSDSVEQLRNIMGDLENAGIVLRKPRGRVQIERSKAYSGIRLAKMGKISGGTEDDVRKLLESYRVFNALVKIYGEVSLDDVEKALFEALVYKPSVVILNKTDLLSSEAVERQLRELREVAPYLQILPASATTGVGLEVVPKYLFTILELIRVYTKEPNSKEPSREPLVIPKGSTVEDAVKYIREEFLKYFKYARIWGPSAKYPGEKVGLDHVLSDGDVIEIRTHIRGI
ncbi:MAG: GTPase [Sulfolobales archaeon]|nr:50S ribosome-binding GTPase [Sulfolobales archaeon]MDW8083172.1 GTPase [Sulfolobales archaeon]